MFSSPMIFEAQNSLIVFGEVFVFHQIPSGPGFHQPFPGRVSFGVLKLRVRASQWLDDISFWDKRPFF